MLQIGNIHPVLVHLPIGIIVFAFLLELLALRKKSAIQRETILLALYMTAITAAASVATGWYLSTNGNYDEDLLWKHKWVAIAFAASTLLLISLKHTQSEFSRKIYMPVFVSTMILLVIAGHLGGSITHGEDFLFNSAEQRKLEVVNAQEAMVYDEIIQPLLNNKCSSCHNSSKSKGGLVLTSATALLEGGESGSVIDSNGTQAPALIHRALLPLEDEDHMPPKGKVQLNANEIALIQWWLENGHCLDCRTKSLAQSTEIEAVLRSIEKDTSMLAKLTEEVAPVDEDWLAEVQQGGITINRLAADSPLLTANLSHRKNLTAAVFKKLRKYGDNLVELHLGYSNFNDTLAVYLNDFENLLKLQLQQTGITDKSAKYIAKLKRLESLNLYSTEISDPFLDELTALPNLKKIFLWQTAVSDDRLLAFANKQQATIYSQAADSLFSDTSIQPPLILADTPIFEDSLAVTIDHLLDRAQPFYIVGNSEAQAYNGPLVIREPTTISAYAVHPSFGQSDTVRMQFKKRILTYDTLLLAQLPAERYKGQGSNTLTDLKRGTSNFVDGNWLGYEGQHLTATLKLKETKNISSVSVGALSAPGNWIFFPRGMRVWTSEDGTNFRQVGKTEEAEPQPSGDIALKFFDLNIPPTRARYVKVEVRSQLRNPDWHQQPGGKSWLFVDEIIVN